MANHSGEHYPKNKMEFHEYNSFVATSLMLKKEKDVEQGK